LLDAEGWLGVGQLDVSPPEVFVAQAGHVGAEYVGAFAELGPGPPLFDLLPGDLGSAIGRGGNPDIKQARSPGVLSQQASHTPLDLADRVAALRTSGRDLVQPVFDPLLEPGVHRLLFLPAITAATQDVGLAAAVGTGTQLDLQPVADGMPVGSCQLLLESLELALGRSHDVLPLPSFQEVEVVFR